MRQTVLHCVLLAVCAGAVPYSQYILAPPSRTIHPVSLYAFNGTVENPKSLLADQCSTGDATFVGNAAATYDFGLNIGGLISVKFGRGNPTGCVGLTFTESSMWISGEGSDATADAGLDAPLWLCVKDADRRGIVSADRDHVRGAFRYLSILRNGTGSTDIAELWTHFTAMPHVADDALREYTGYFHSNDEKLNRVWYAGAYTNQLCTIDPSTGNALIHLRKINAGDPVSLPVSWYNNHTICEGTSCLTDGAKRDRLVWAGDMAIAVPAVAVSTKDLISVRNALDSLFALQGAEGNLPYAGTPFNELGINSATYHLYTLIGIHDFYHFTGDLDFLKSYWARWKQAMEFSLKSVDDTGLMYVTIPDDWLRFGMGGHNIEANSILYHTLDLGIKLARVLDDNSVVERWAMVATKVKATANSLLWSSSDGLFYDNETTTLAPQDGNVWAVKSGLADSDAKTASISKNLAARWTPIGAPAPEADYAVSPFISGFELETHFMAGHPQRALDLIRLMWADFMLDDPRMTNSTFIEGYSSSSTLAAGILHYPPFPNDPRVSHAHGWATAPTSLLTFYVAGIHLIEPQGRRWLFKPPQFGDVDLKKATAGFETGLGKFEAYWKVFQHGKGNTLAVIRVSAPPGTEGSIKLSFSRHVPWCSDNRAVRARVQDLNIRNQVPFESKWDGTFEISVENLKGGVHRYILECE